MALGRGEIAKRFGAPTDQVGSVNDPRTAEDHGVKWNEMWVYKNPGGAGFDRVILWNRYDLLGAWRVFPGGRAEPEPLPDA